MSFCGTKETVIILVFALWQVNVFSRTANGGLLHTNIFKLVWARTVIVITNSSKVSSPGLQPSPLGDLSSVLNNNPKGCRQEINVLRQD